jgi:hypothetical protein
MKNCRMSIADLRLQAAIPSPRSLRRPVAANQFRPTASASSGRRD